MKENELKLMQKDVVFVRHLDNILSTFKEQYENGDVVDIVLTSLDYASDSKHIGLGAMNRDNFHDVVMIARNFMAGRLARMGYEGKEAEPYYPGCENVNYVNSSTPTVKTLGDAL